MKQKQIIILILLILSLNIYAKDTRITSIHSNPNIKVIELEHYNEQLAILPNGQVIDDGVILTSDNKLIKEFARIAWGKKLNQHSVLKPTFKPTIKKFKGRLAVVTTKGSDNYYHWLFQVIPRIILIKESKIEYDRLYFYALNQPYQKQTLSLFNISPSDYIEGNSEVLLQADELIAPTIPVWFAQGKDFKKWVVHYLNNLYLKSEIKDTNLPKKIFISRKKAKTRRVANINELEAFLKKNGISTVHLENYSILQQATLFKNADLIIAVHGSALSNLVFSKNAKVIEINSSDGHKGPFKRLAEIRGLHYQQFNTSNTKLTKLQKMNDDVHVNIKKLQNTLI